MLRFKIQVCAYRLFSTQQHKRLHTQTSKELLPQLQTAKVSRRVTKSMQCFVLYYSKGTNTEEMNHVVSFMMSYLVCGHIVIKKNYSSIQYVYFVFATLTCYQNYERGLIPTRRQEQLSENVLSQPVSCNLNGVIGSHALYSFFCLIHFIVQNQFATQRAKRVVSQRCHTITGMV